MDRVQRKGRMETAGLPPGGHDVNVRSSSRPGAAPGPGADGARRPSRIGSLSGQRLETDAVSGRRVGPRRSVSIESFTRNAAPAARELGFRSLMVYTIHMPRTNIDIDAEACAEVMRRYRLSTKREAVNFALRMVAAEPLGLDEARGLRGSGWDGDLDEMRSGRAR